MSSFIYELQDNHIKDLINAYYNEENEFGFCEKFDIMVEQICENLIGQTVIVVNYPEPDVLFTTKEILVEKVQSNHLYGISNGQPVKLYIPSNYIYHPAILAAIKCL